MTRQSVGHNSPPPPATPPLNNDRTGAVRRITGAATFPPGTIKVSPMTKSFASARLLNAIILSASALYFFAMLETVSPLLTLYNTPSVGGIVIFCPGRIKLCKFKSLAHRSVLTFNPNRAEIEYRESPDSITKVSTASRFAVDGAISGITVGERSATGVVTETYGSPS